MKYYLVLFSIIFLSSCATKIVGKNCSQTHDGNYYVCDTVWVIK